MGQDRRPRTANLGIVLGPLAVLTAIAVGGIGYSHQAVAKKAVQAAEPAHKQDPLEELRAGNMRFVNSRRTNSADTAHDAEWRQRLSREQHPFVTILCCADSRVCPEFIFDQRIGSIFEIRTAGNVVDDDVMASIEYAVEHLKVPLIVVLAHKGCGAIAAVHEAGDKPLHDHLKALQLHMEGIREQVLRTHDDHSTSWLERLSKENARQQALLLRRESEPIAAALERGECRLVYGLYDMKTGAVEFWDVDEGH